MRVNTPSASVTWQTGRSASLESRHDRDDVRGFYPQFTGEVVVGVVVLREII